MTTKVDDFMVGRWYAIVSEAEQEVQQDFNPFFQQHRNAYVNGRPLKLLAMSLPFAVFTDGRERFTLDTRQFGFIRLNYRYIKAIGIREERTERGRIVTLENPEQRRRKRESEEGCCPICGCQLRQKFRDQDGDWLLHCIGCGFEGGLPKD